VEGWRPLGVGRAAPFPPRSGAAPLSPNCLLFSKDALRKHDLVE
jgi:hypothetical protein